MSLCFSSLSPRPPSSPLFPYTTLFRSRRASMLDAGQDDSPTFTRSGHAATDMVIGSCYDFVTVSSRRPGVRSRVAIRSEEHTSELQSRFDLVCRLLLEKKKKATKKEII